jgi:hypothetical protein
MTKDEAIQTAKQFRKDADDLLQRMKAHKRELVKSMAGNDVSSDMGEVIAQHVLSMRDLESCIMRQGMTLKYVGQPDPYPQSYNPANTVVEPTADGLKL